MLPMETDLNRPPLLTDFPEKVLPLAAVKSRITGGIFCLLSQVSSQAYSGLLKFLKLSSNAYFSLLVYAWVGPVSVFNSAILSCEYY